MKTKRLSDLVLHGRMSINVGPTSGEAAPVASVTCPPSAEPAFLPRSPSRLRASFDAIDKIELLAVQLLSISKTCKSNPESALREALIAIDQCIDSISSTH